MASRHQKKVENAPKRVWMMDVPKGYIEISDHLMWIYYGPGHPKEEIRINARTLWEQLKIAKEGHPVPVGELDFLPIMDNGVMMIHVFYPEDDKRELPYGFQITLFCLKEALVPFLKFC